MVFGWFGKGGGETPRAGDEVGCFGKMPIHADFIRHNVRLRETVALDAWIQEGTSCLARTGGGAWPEAYLDFPGINFVLVGGEQERTVAGTLMGSRDRGGRSYPFLIFLAAADLLFRQMQAASPFYYQEFFSRAGEICSDRWTGEPVSLLLGRVDGLFRRDGIVTRRHLLERQISLLQEVELGSFDEAVPGGAEGLFAAVMEALRQALRRGATRVPWGLRLPLPFRGDVAPFVVFWVQLIESALEDRSLRCHYFWSAEEGGRRAGLSLFFRPVPASYLLAVIDPEHHESVLFDPLKEKVSVRWDDPDTKRLLNDGRSSLLDVLYRLGRREALG